MHVYFWIYLIEKLKNAWLQNFSSSISNKSSHHLFLLMFRLFLWKKVLWTTNETMFENKCNEMSQAVWFFALSVRLDLRYSFYNANVIDDPIWLKKRYPIFSSNAQCVHVSTAHTHFQEPKIFYNIFLDWTEIVYV